MEIDTIMTIDTTQPSTSKKRVLKESGLGERLKTARGTLRLSEKDAALRLRLNPQIISIIENEDFDNDTGPPATFMRGYIRSYARLLNFPDEEINAAFMQLDAHSTEIFSLKSKPLIKNHASQKSHHYIRRATYLIAAALIGLVSLWWASHPKDATTPKPQLTIAAPLAIKEPAPTLTSPAPPASVAKPITPAAPKKASEDVDAAIDDAANNNTVSDGDVYN